MCLRWVPGYDSRSGRRRIFARCGKTPYGAVMNRILYTLLFFATLPLQSAWAGALDVAQAAVQTARANAALTMTGPLVSDPTLECLHRDLLAMRVHLEPGDVLLVKLELALMGIEVVQAGDWEFMESSPSPMSDPELQRVVEAASSLEFEANALLAMIHRAESDGSRSDVSPRYVASGVQRRVVPGPSATRSSPEPVVVAAPAIELQPQPLIYGASGSVDEARGVVIPMTSGTAAALAEPFSGLQGAGRSSVGASTSERWLEPVEQPRITSSFGMRTHPVTGRRRMHRGVDYGAPVGTRVRATASGRVLMAGWCGNGPGNCVVIEHVNGWRSQYFHLEEVHVSAGTSVAQGAEIGEVGSTGLSTGPHLHFQVGRDGQAVDPVSLLGSAIE